MKAILFFILFLSVIQASTLNLTISSNPSRINPILSTDSASSEITNWLFNGLFKYDKDGVIVPDLAKGYRFIDETTLVIELKENVLWHDGVVFSADDVVFTYEKIKDPTIFTPVSTDFLKVISVEKLDSLTVKIRYTEPYFKALNIWMTGILPKHILENEKDMMTSSFNKHPIGTGSYKLKQFIPSKDIILLRNENYFDKKPKIDTILYKFVPDPTTSYYMLTQKQIDMGGLSPIQVERQIDNSFKEDFNIFEQQSYSYTYLGFNLRDEKFKNIKIRKAIDLAIDKQQLLNILFFGHGKVCEGPFLPGSIAFNEKVKSPKTNINKAKEILKSLGYDENNRFEFTVVTNANNSIRVNAAQIIQHQLQKANIDMKIKVMEWQAFLNTIVHPRNFEAVLLGWGLSLTADARSIWHSNSDKKGGFNFVGFQNKTVDSLIEKAEITVDQKEFGLIYKKIFKIIHQELPYVFLYIPNSISAVNKKIKNVTPSLIGVMHNFEEWEKETIKE